MFIIYICKQSNGPLRTDLIQNFSGHIEKSHAKAAVSKWQCKWQCHACRSRELAQYVSVNQSCFTTMCMSAVPQSDDGSCQPHPVSCHLLSGCDAPLSSALSVDNARFLYGYHRKRCALLHQSAPLFNKRPYNHTQACLHWQTHRHCDRSVTDTDYNGVIIITDKHL